MNTRLDQPMSAAIVAALTLTCGSPANAGEVEQPVDLNTWTAESYPAVAGFSPGLWTVAPDGLSVYQSVNGQPTLFYSDFNAFNTSFKGNAVVETGGDDDFFGFALGFQPGDTANPGADYLLIDWKMLNQFFDFGAPSCTPGSLAPAGLAVSRVIGIPTADEFWGHENFDSPACSNLDNGLTELQRGINLDSTGWSDFVEYEFQFDFTATSLRVFVDGVLELDIAGSFADGRIAFYNFSQACVRYSGFTVSPLGACCNEFDMTCVSGVLEADCQGPGDQWFEDTNCDDLDLDGDGFAACAGDCDDSDPLVFPGAEEICNDIDDDCDGEIDEGGLCVLDISLDIKPGSCPNSFNRNSNGVLPVGVLGSADFDVTEVDISTLLISRADAVGGSAAPNEGPPGPHTVVADVGTPFGGDLCDCHELEGDGIPDLSVKFKTQDVVGALELNDLPPGALVELVVSGALLDGTPFEGSDCIRLVPPGTPPGMMSVQTSAPGAWVNASPLDLQLDGGGFGTFERVYPLGTFTIVTAEATHFDRPFVGWKIDGQLLRTTSLSMPLLIYSKEVKVEAIYEEPDGSDTTPTAPDSQGPSPGGLEPE